jgi:hypothetical protein
MFLAMVASLAIVVSDHASVRSMPRSTATELTTLWQGDVVEIRGEQAEYLKVYSYRRERGGYLRNGSVRKVAFTEADAPELLAVMRFLRDTPGSEALGISYGAAYLKAVSPRALTAEAFDAIGQMAERLADTASGSHADSVAARLEVVGQFGVHMRTFERDGRMQVCYDGELFRNVLTSPGANAEQRAHAVLALTRADCIEPEMGLTARVALDEERRDLLDQVQDANLTPVTRSRIRARRAGVLSSVAFAQARRGQASVLTAQRALAELISVHAADLGETYQSEYADAVLRVSAIRWATAAIPAASAPAAATNLRVNQPDPGAIDVSVLLLLNSSSPVSLSAAPGTEAGQTCLTLERQNPKTTLARRCTFGIVWPASAQAIPSAQAIVLSVQPLESWRELWVFHQIAGKWLVDVISPGLDEPEQGYVEYAGFAPGTLRILLVREVKERTRYRRWFEEVRLDDLVVVRQASTPELLRDFGRWQDVRWRRDTLALR